MDQLDLPNALKNLTQGEKEKFKKLKEEIAKFPEKILKPNSEFLSEDITYLKYLRHNCFNVKNTIKNLEKVLKWRTEYIPTIDLHQYRKDIIEKKLENWKFMSIHGFDKKENPVTYLRMVEDYALPNDEFGLEMKFKLVIIVNEDFAKRKYGKNSLHQSCVIIDAKNIGLGFIPSLRLLCNKFNSLNDWYAQTLGSALVLNYSFLLSSLYKIISFFLFEYTRNRIVFCRNNAHLKEFIDEDQILEEFGGNVKKEDVKGTVLEYINNLIEIKEKEKEMVNENNKSLPEKDCKMENKEIKEGEIVDSKEIEIEEKGKNMVNEILIDKSTNKEEEDKEIKNNENEKKKEKEDLEMNND